MRRADRLIQLLALMKERPLSRAEDLAERLEVSARTVYRDIAVLQAQGFPIDGQAGVGYILREPVDLPPLTFDHDELDALALGLAYVAEVGDPELAAAARSARGKVDAAWTGRAIPSPSARAIRATQRPERRAPAFAAALRAAIRVRRRVVFGYTDRGGRPSERTVRPLAVAAFSEGWLLVAWCEARAAFRVFRLDRMENPHTGERFEEEAGRALADYLAQRGPDPHWRLRELSPI